jgi:hypothetical protein
LFLLQVVVGAGFPKTSVSFLYNDESDQGPYPVPIDGPIETNCLSNWFDDRLAYLGDRHLLVLDSSSCKVYELYNTFPLSAQYRQWLGVSAYADSGAIFDLNEIRYRTLGFTSSDAAGLSVIAGMMHYEEIAVTRQVNHAIRFTIANPGRGYLSPPATHLVGSLSPEIAMPMGTRLRLKASFNCTALATPESRVVCAGMKRHGLILADIGSNFYFSGSPDPRFDDSKLQPLQTIPGTSFDVVDIGSRLCSVPDCTS